MIYLAGWGINYLAILISTLTKYRGKLFFIIALLFFAAISIFRGAVGTDTANYENKLSSYVNLDECQGGEPGFVAIGWTLIKLFDSPGISVRSISLIFFLLLILFLIRANKNELYLLMVYILPVFSYQYSMNALRVGIASSILLLAIQEFRKNNQHTGFAILFTTILFHYSIALSSFFIITTQIKYINRRNILYFSVFLIIIFCLFFLKINYFYYKFSIYETMQPPNFYSGLSKVLVIFIILTGLFLSRISMEVKMRIIIPGFLLTVFLGAMVNFTYAGLRFLDLLSFALPVAITATYSRLGLNFDKSFRLSLFLGGIVSVAAIYRGFLLSAGKGSSPFLPYQLFQISL